MQNQNTEIKIPNGQVTITIDAKNGITTIKINTPALCDKAEQNKAWDDDKEQMYQDAKQAVLKAQKPSISFIQRKLNIGYNTAADLIERMQSENLVSEPDETGHRKILNRATLV